MEYIRVTTVHLLGQDTNNLLEILYLCGLWGFCGFVLPRKYQESDFLVKCLKCKVFTKKYTKNDDHKKPE